MIDWFSELYRIIKLISYGGVSKKLTAQLISALDETLSTSSGGSNTSVIDLGVITAADVNRASAGFVELLPYVPGRFIKSIRYFPDNYVPVTSNRQTLMFITPNMGQNDNGLASAGGGNVNTDSQGMQTSALSCALDPSTGISSGDKNQILDCGPLAITASLFNGDERRQTWSSKSWALGEIIINDAGFIQYVTTNGTSDVTEPTWDNTPDNTTTDGTVIWTCFDTADIDGQFHACAEVVTGLDEITYPSTLEFSQQPTDIVSGDAFNPVVKVRILDQFGDPYSSSSVTFQIQLIGDGTMTNNAGASSDWPGVAEAVFTGMTLTADPSSSRVLVATVSQLSCPLLRVVSDPFDVTAP